MKSIHSHGGKRRGAGAKKKLTAPIVRNTYLDAETESIMSTLGDGNVSLGIRRAGELVKWLQLKHPSMIQSAQSNKE